MHLPLLCPTLPGWWWVGLAMFDPIAACPLEGAFALYGELLLYIRTFVWSCEKTIRANPQVCPTSYKPGRVGKQ